MNLTSRETQFNGKCDNIACRWIDENLNCYRYFDLYPILIREDIKWNGNIHAQFFLHFFQKQACVKRMVILKCIAFVKLYLLSTYLWGIDVAARGCLCMLPKYNASTWCAVLRNAVLWLCNYFRDSSLFQQIFEINVWHV